MSLMEQARLFHQIYCSSKFKNKPINLTDFISSVQGNTSERS